MNKTPNTRRISAIVAIILGVSSLSGCGSKELSDIEHVNRAKTFVEENDTRAAAIELKNALRKNPGNIEARIMLGLAYVGLKNGEGAEKELLRARELGAHESLWAVPLGKAYLLQKKGKDLLDNVNIGPEAKKNDIPTIHALRGLAHLQAGQQNTAINELDQALALDSKETYALLGKAQIAINQNHLEEGMALIDTIITSDPRNLDAWIAKASLSKLLEKPEAASDAFEHALKIDKNDINALAGAIDADITLKKPVNAREKLQRLHKLSPQYPPANYFDAVLKADAGDLAGAEEALGKVLKLIPSHLPSLLLMGTLQYEKKNYEQAERNLGQFLAAVPKNLRATMLLGATNLALRQPGRAVEILKEVESQGEIDAQFLNLLGTAYILAGRADEGTERLQKALDLAPSDPKIQTQLGLSFLAGGDAKHAVKLLESAANASTEIGRADIALVITHLRARNYDTALAAADSIVRKQPKNPAGYNFRGIALTQKQQKEEARKAFEHALEVDAKFMTAAANIARLDEAEGNRSAAEQRYRSILKTSKNHEEAMLSLARLANTSGNMAESRDWLQKSHEGNPQSAASALALARFYLQEGDEIKALQTANDIAAKEPGDRAVLEILGIAQLASAQAANAVATFEKLVRAQPRTPQSLVQLARAHLENRNPNAARAQLTKALEIDKTFYSALVALAELEIQQGRAEQALRLAEGLKKNSDGEGWRLEGDTRAMQKLYAKAMTAYTNAMQIAPTSRAAIRLSDAQRLAGDDTSAEKTLQVWLSKKPQDSSVRIRLAYIFHKTNKRDEAIAEYRKILDSNPNNLAVLNNLAWIYIEKQDKQGIETAKKAFSFSKQNPTLADTYGWALTQLGAPKEGLSILRQANLETPNDPELRFHLAGALSKNGNRDAAILELQKLLSDKTEFPSREGAKALFTSLKTHN